MFNYFSISGIFIGVINLGLAILISISGKSKLHKIWSYVNYSISLFGLGIFISGYASNFPTALIGWKTFIIGIILIAVFYYHVIFLFCNLHSNRFLFFNYIFAFVSITLTLFTNVLTQVYYAPKLHLYYVKAGYAFTVFMFLWSVIVGKSFFELYKFIRRSSGISNIQAKYLFFAMMFGFGGGLNTAPAAWSFNVYPYGQIFVCLYGAVITYAILRYQLMDIRVAITRLGVFIFVYSLVLGIPVWLGFKLLGKGLWLLPVTFMGVFATLGPFIYLFIQKRAEDRLLQEQRRYQATLRQASAGMGKIKDLKKLLNMIVYVLTHAIQMEHAIIYIYDENQKRYVLGAVKRKSGYSKFIEIIEKNSTLVEYFLKNKNPLIFEEIKQRAQDYKDSQLIQLDKIIASLEGALVVPIFIDQDLIAIIIMGNKESGKPYTGDDLAVFSILANQTALAIENAKFYEDMKFTHEQLFQAEKMATIGTMADGLSHQINNRFHALGFIAGDALDTIRLNKNEMTPEKLKEVMEELDRAFVRVQENVIQGGEIVQGLLKYTRKGDAGFTAVDVDAVLKSAIEMVQFKIKMHELKIVRDYDLTTVPKIKANFTQLQEVFFNLIDNGYDAMMQRKNEAKEPSYQPTLIVRVLKEDNRALIIFEDNGMGVKDDDMHKLFTPFFTTKLSSKKGTGLGLYVIKKIVEDNHGGKVEMVSKYMQGTQMKLRLPIAIG